MERTHRRNIHFTLRTTRKLLLTKLAIRRLFLLKYVTLSYLLVISIKRAEALINTPPPLPEKGNVPQWKSPGIIASLLIHLLVIKDWSVSAPFSHLAGCMKYHDGKLTVPIQGRYYIYLQAYYHTTGRILMRVNGRVITMIQIPGRSGHGTAYVGGIFNLKAGDVITMTSAGNNLKLYMDTVHTYFGAYLI